MFSLIIEYTFLQNAFIGAFISSIVCGIIGTIVVEKKLVMMSGGIAHASFGGIGLGYYLGIEPIIGGIIFSLISSSGIVYVKKNSNSDSDTLIGILWSVGMALGILFIALTPGYPPDMTSYLFGDILTISKTDLTISGIICVVVAFIIISSYKYWQIYLFDSEFAQSIGIPIMKYEYTLYMLITLSIIILIKIVGIILVISLLTTPPAIAKIFFMKLKSIIIFSIILGIIFSFCGLILSYLFNIQSGATIIILLAVGYMISIIVRKILYKRTNLLKN